MIMLINVKLSNENVRLQLEIGNMVGPKLILQPSYFGTYSSSLLSIMSSIFSLYPPHRGYISFVNTFVTHRNNDLRPYVP